MGGPVRDAFLGRAHSDLDLATDATPPQVLAIARDWADKVWETGIEFGTVGLRKGDVILEITTYRRTTRYRARLSQTRGRPVWHFAGRRPAAA